MEYDIRFDWVTLRFPTEYIVKPQRFSIVIYTAADDNHLIFISENYLNCTILYIFNTINITHFEKLQILF